nr:nucleic acid-binding, OB-fold protein [Tanacetum cinerariifolium]
MALTFNIIGYEAMEKPVVIAITLCWVRHFNGNQLNSLIKDCNELLAELFEKNPYKLPSALKELEGTTHIFQFHFDTNSTSRKKDFVLDTVFTNTILPLTPPVKHVEPKPISPELPKPIMLTETPIRALSRTASNQFDPQLNITTPSQ